MPVPFIEARTNRKELAIEADALNWLAKMPCGEKTTGNSAQTNRKLSMRSGSEPKEGRKSASEEIKQTAGMHNTNNEHSKINESSMH